VKDEIRVAIAWAEEEPFPEARELLTDITGDEVDRVLSYVDAIRITDQEMEGSSVVVLGSTWMIQGHSGTTRGLAEKYGPERVFGATFRRSDDRCCHRYGPGRLRPIHIHIRMDFFTMAMNQLVNVMTKSRYMYGGQVHANGAGADRQKLGPGAQHSQGCIPFSCTFRAEGGRSH
jgi:pyruvate/2-oxoglutarate/acetoin dehydrogenase E1 component